MFEVMGKVTYWWVATLAVMSKPFEVTLHLKLGEKLVLGARTRQALANYLLCYNILNIKMTLKIKH